MDVLTAFSGRIAWLDVFLRVMTMSIENKTEQLNQLMQQRILILDGAMAVS